LILSFLVYIDCEKDDLLELMLKFKDEDQGLSLEEIVTETRLLFLAGYETSRNTLCWFFYALSLYPEWQEKLQEEVDNIIGKSDITFDKIGQLHTTTLILKEVMRLYPTVNQTVRHCSEDTVLCGYKIPKGTAAICSFYNVNRSPEYWVDPEKFNPLRFENLENSSKYHPCQYMAFGFGPKRCLGEKFALLEMKTIIAEIALQYTWNLAPGYPPVEAINSITCGPKNGLWLNFKLRKLVQNSSK